MQEISAGGVVYRRDGETIVMQLIQDRYGKIALPKGKMEAGETVEETALREIQEETGITGKIIAPLAQIHYDYKSPVHGKVKKTVHYFLVEATGGDTKAQIEEIRGVEWLALDDAWAMQQASGYANNNTVVEKALQLLQDDGEKDGEKDGKEDGTNES